MVYHILKDGTVTTDITGHVVQLEDAPILYRLINEVNRGASEKLHKEESKEVNV